MSEPRDPPRLPENVALYIAPGMNTVTFAELMMGFGIRRDLSEWMESISQQLASVMADVAELKSQLPIPAAEPAAEAPQQEPPPSRPMPPRRPHR